MQIDFSHIEELEHLYEQLSEIRKCLNSALEEEAVARMEFLRACAKVGGMEKLSEQSRFILLCGMGYEDTTRRLIEAEKEVSKAKAGFRVAEHAINIKKHIGNISPRA